MKQIYEAPKAVLTGFAPQEALAAVIEFDDLVKLEGEGGVGTPVQPSDNDINIGA